MNAPKALNGHPVIASAPRRGMSDMLAVVVYRVAARDYVVASWSPMLGTGWSWGHYYENLIEAVGHFAHMTGQTDIMKTEAWA